MPLLVDLQPAGRYLMDDLHRAGGLLAVLHQVRDLLDPRMRGGIGRYGSKAGKKVLRNLISPVPRSGVTND